MLYVQPPVPLTKFISPGILDCSKERDSCFQKDYVSLKVIGSEDCLYLNVFTPQLTKIDAYSTGVKPLAVMIWIHGGGFMAGNGNSDV